MCIPNSKPKSPNFDWLLRTRNSIATILYHSYVELPQSSPERTAL